MKHNQLIGKIALVAILFTMSCQKNEVPQPSFDVNVANSTYKVGEPVPFTFNGNPDFISFYSGEFGKDYAFSTGRIMDIQSFSITFQTRLQAGAQNKQLSVLLSSDFNGKYDMASVEAATWKDITNLFSFSLTTLDYFSAGEVDISALVADKSKPLYVAFRYITLPQTTANGVWRNTLVRNFEFNTVTSAGKSAALAPLTAGWILLEKGEILEASRNSVSASTGSITFRGNTTTAGKLVQTEVWAVSNFVQVDKVDLGPDKSMPIKGISEPLPLVYNYVFTTPGTYKTVFTALNSRLYGDKALVKENTITIVP